MTRWARPPRRRGPYAALSAFYYDDEKIIEAGWRAEVLYVRALAFSARARQDGFISYEQCRKCAAPARVWRSYAHTLCTVGLWEELPERGGFQIISWLGWNPSQEHFLAAQAADGRRRGNRQQAERVSKAAPETVDRPPASLTVRKEKKRKEIDGRSPMGPDRPSIPPDLSALRERLRDASARRKAEDAARARRAADHFRLREKGGADEVLPDGQ